MRPPRWRRLARWTFLVLVLVAIAAWLGRDLPRRLLERQLGRLTGGAAKLGGIDWPHDGLFVLHEIEIEAPELAPAVRRVVCRRLEARTSWAGLLRRELGEVHLFGLEIRADPAWPLLAAGGEGLAEPAFRLLVAEPGARLVAEDGAGRRLAEADFRAEVRGEPGYPATVEARVAGLDPGDLEMALPLELPAAARPYLEGLDFGELQLDASWSPGPPAVLELKLRGHAFAEAGLMLRDERLELRLRGLELAALGGPEAPLRAEGRADLEASGSLDEGVTRLTLSGARLKQGDRQAELGPVVVEARYRQEEEGLVVNVDRLAAELRAVDGLPAAAAELLPLRLAWRGELALGPRRAQGEGSLIAAGLGALPFSGGLGVAEGLELQVKSPRLPLSRLLELVPEELRPFPGTAGWVEAQATLRGPPAAVRVTADFRVGGLAPRPEVPELGGEGRLAWSADAPSEFRLERLAGGATLRPPLPGWAELALTFALGGEADLERRRFRWRGLELETPQLGRLTGEGELELPPGWELAGARAAFRGELREAGVAPWLAAFGTPLPAGLSFSGAVSASPEIAKEAGAPWRMSGSFRLAGAGFASVQGDRVLEGLTLDGELQAEAAPALAAGDAYRLEARATGSGFQLLWGTLFGDFQGAAPRLRARASGTLGGAPSLFAEAALGPGLAASASLDGDHTYRLELAAADLEAARRDWLLPLFQNGAPPLLFGRLAAQATGHLPAGAEPFSARGELKLENVRIEQPGFLAEGLELLLPFDLEGRNGAYRGPRREGRLAAARIQVGAFTVPPVASRLWVEADAAGLEEPLEIAFAGGQVRLASVAARGLLAATPRLETAVAFSGVSLAELAAGAGALPIEGRLDGSLPRVVAEGNRLEVDGGGKIALFGGELELSEISGSDVFSAYPRLRLSVRFHDIDLGLLTRRFDFGEMHGIVEGEVDHLVLFRNLPLSFDARVASAPRRGVAQTIDVKAVKNLTILGTGAAGGANPLDRGLQRFFKRYNYAALGIKAQLANDVLLLRGLEERGGRELFLRGKLPFPIDVVNAQPGKTVAFLAMVRRLKSLDLGSVRTER